MPVADGLRLAGTLYGSITLGDQAPLELTPRPDPDPGDAYVAALDSNGEPLWALVFGSDGFDMARSLVAADDGGVVTGGYLGSGGEEQALSVPGLDTSALVGDAGSSADGFVLGVDGDGAPRWIFGMTSQGEDSPVHLDAYDDGAVLVSSWCNLDGPAASLRFSDGEEQEVDRLTEVLMRVEPDGARGWTRTVDAAWGMGVQVLTDGGVAMAHLFEAGATFGSGEPFQQQPTSEGAMDGAVSRHHP